MKREDIWVEAFRVVALFQQTVPDSWQRSIRALIYSIKRSDTHAYNTWTPEEIKLLISDLESLTLGTS